MPFQGADTDALRHQATAFTRSARTMDEQCSALTALVMSVSWQGADADQLRQRWTEVDRQLRSRAAEVDGLGAELTTHADEQDRASSTGTGAGGAGTAGADGLGLGLGLSLPDLSDWVGRGLGLTSDIVDVARALGGHGNGLGNPLTAALHPGGGGSSNPALPDISEIIGIFGGSDNGGFTHEPGSDSRTSTVTIELPNGDTVAVSASDGATTHQLTEGQTVKIPIGNGGESVTLTAEMAESFTVAVNPDGTLTYTFDYDLSHETAVSSENKLWGLEHGEGEGMSRSHSVTVPAGTSVAEAMRINPYDPSSIPTGAEVAMETSQYDTSRTDLQVDARRTPPLLFGASSKDGEGTMTVVSRHEDGSLSVLAGPTSSLEKGGHVGVGTEDLNLRLTSNVTNSDAQLEYARFADSRAGNEAFSDAVRSGDLPQATSAPVVERYSESRDAGTISEGFAATAGRAGASSEENTYTAEHVVRTHPDGTRIWTEQVLPNGTDEGSSVRAYGGTGQETEYHVHIESDQHSTAAEQYYGRDGNGDLDLVFGEDEVTRMRENSPNSAPGDSNTDYIAGQAKQSEVASPDVAVRDIVNDYNGRGPQLTGSQDQSSDVEIPGRLK